MNQDLSNSEIDINSLMGQLSGMKIGTISVQTIIVLLLLSLILIGFFYVAGKYVIPYLNSRKAVQKTKFRLFKLEVLAWAVFTLFALYNLLAESLWISGFIILAVGLIGFNYWRDLFMGIVFRLENNFKKGDPVQYMDHKGLIYKIDKRNIQLKTEDEELIFIPYRGISKDLLIKRQAKGKLKTAKLVINLNDLTFDEIVPKIQNLVFECPWAIMLEKPLVQLLENDRAGFSVYAVDHESIERVEKYLKSNL